MLAARRAALIVATTIGGAIVASIGAGSTLTALGAATVVLAALATAPGDETWAKCAAR